MKRIKKRVTKYENVFITDDGTEFSYEGDAREYDLKIKKEALKGLDSIENGVLPFANAKYSFYYAETEEDYNKILAYFNMKYGEQMNSVMKSSKQPSFPEWYGVFESFGENAADDVHIGDCLCFASLADFEKMMDNFRDQFDNRR